MRAVVASTSVTKLNTAPDATALTGSAVIACAMRLVCSAMCA